MTDDELHPDLERLADLLAKERAVETNLGVFFVHETQPSVGASRRSIPFFVRSEALRDALQLAGDGLPRMLDESDREVEIAPPAVRVTFECAWWLADVLRKLADEEGRARYSGFGKFILEIKRGVRTLRFVPSQALKARVAR